MMPLTMAHTGEVIRIKQIAGKDETKRHLENLGFVAGEEVSIVSELAGNLIVYIKGARIALDRSMAKRILV